MFSSLCVKRRVGAATVVIEHPDGVRLVCTLRKHHPLAVHLSPSPTLTLGPDRDVVLEVRQLDALGEPRWITVDAWYVTTTAPDELTERVGRVGRAEHSHVVKALLMMLVTDQS